MIITTFENKFDNLVHLGERSIEWSDFKDFILGVEPTVWDTKDEIPAVVFGDWRTLDDPRVERRPDGQVRRVQANFLRLHALTLDIEQRLGCPPITRALVEEALDGLDYVAWTTHSHLKPGKGERYRAVIPLTTPLDGPTIARLARFNKGIPSGALPELFPFVDPVTFKHLQLAYLPATSPGAPYEAWSRQGQWFDWSVLDLLPEPPAIERPAHDHLSADNTGLADLRTLDLFRWFDDFGAIHGTVAYGQPRIRVTCPNRMQHTDKANDGAALLLQSDGSYGFNCFHSSCADRNGMNLKRFIKSIDPQWASYCLREKALTIEDVVQQLQRKTYD